jgi:hypothetical protein
MSQTSRRRRCQGQISKTNDENVDIIHDIFTYYLLLLLLLLLFIIIIINLIIIFIQCPSVRRKLGGRKREARGPRYSV